MVVAAFLEHDQLRGEVETLWVQHAHALESTANAAALTQQNALMTSMHEGLAVRLPDAIDEQVLRDQIRAEAAEAGLQVEALEVAPSHLREFYGQRPVRLVAIGQVNAVHAMLVEVLSAPPLRRIHAVSLERTQDESAPVLRMEPELQTYHYHAP